MNDSKKAQLLEKLIKLNSDFNHIKQQINLFAWDCQAPLVLLKLTDVQTLLEGCLSKHILSSQLQEWAEFIECREDIAFEEVHKEKSI